MPRYPKVRIGGIEATVVPDSVAEECAVAMCAPWDGPRYFSDDVKATCVGCGRAVRHRPYMPKKPMKLCMECAIAWVSRH